MSTSVDPLARAMAILAHDGEHAYEAVVPPIAQTSLFTFGSYAEMEETYRGQKVRPDLYPRAQSHGPPVRGEDGCSGMRRGCSSGLPAAWRQSLRPF